MSLIGLLGGMVLIAFHPLPNNTLNSTRPAPMPAAAPPTSAWSPSPRNPATTPVPANPAIQTSQAAAPAASGPIDGALPPEATAPARSAMVPDVTGMTLGRAQETLREGGFTAQVNYQDISSPELDGVVLDQDPKSIMMETEQPVSVRVGHYRRNMSPSTSPAPVYVPSQSVTHAPEAPAPVPPAAPASAVAEEPSSEAPQGAQGDSDTTDPSSTPS